SDDSTKIVTDQNERQAGVVVSSANGQKENTIKLQPCCPTNVAWLSDSQIVFDGFADGRRSIWAVDFDGNAQQKFIASDGQDWSPALAPDRTKIIFLSTRSGSKQIWRSNIDGRDPVKLSQLAFDIDSPRYSPDGGKIYFSMLSDGKWRVVRMDAS